MQRSALAGLLVAGSLALAAPALSSHLPARALETGCAPASQYGGHWPMINGDLQSDRDQSAEATIDATNAETLQPTWTFDANFWTKTPNNEVTGYPVESDGCVFVGSSTGNDSAGHHLPGWVFAINADTGMVAWETRVGGGVYSTLAVSDGVVYAFVSRVGSPFVVALDESDGHILWQTTVDDQAGSDGVSSPVVYDGMVWVGVSGTAAELSSTDRGGFQGSTVLLAAAPMAAPDFEPASAPVANGTRTYQPGEIIRKLYTVPPEDWAAGYAGGSQWGTISVDPSTGYGYEGTGNPFNYDHEFRTTNAVLKIDLDPARPTFGQTVLSYKGNVDTYVTTNNAVPCGQIEAVEGVFAAGVDCEHLDLDFGATPNIVTQPGGRKVLVVGQKSGVVHVIDAATMTPVTTVTLGVPSPVGGMVGSSATDGTNLYGPHTVGGYMWSITDTGSINWLSPVADGVHWGPPATLANGLVYTVDLKGFLDIYRAATGIPLAQIPINNAQTGTNPTFSWGGVSVARNTVYASVGVGLTSAGYNSMPDGFVVAYRPLDVNSVTAPVCAATKALPAGSAC